MPSFSSAIWEVREKKGESIIESLLIKRPGVREFLTPLFHDLYDPFLLKNMKAVVERIMLAREQKEKILVYGDYDVDGITGTRILTETLQKIGIETEYFLPHRIDDGYGINAKHFPDFQKRGIDIILTVDNGICAIDEIQKARKYNMEVIITDHHTPAEELPDCLIINPKQKDCNYPFPEIVGATVAYKLAQALRSQFPNELDEAFIKWLIEFAALATVSDCGPIVDENRVIVTLGIQAMKKTSRPCFKSFFDSLGIKREFLDTYTFGFQMGPRINASGRISHPNLGMSFLLTTTEKEATEILQQLDTLNEKRKKMVEEALEEAENIKHETKYLITAYNEKWPIGIVGLLAGKLSEKYHKPSCIMTMNHTSIVGSMRNPLDAYNTLDLLNACAPYLKQYGGHVKAAGFSLSPDQKDHFIQKAHETAQAQISDELLQKKFIIDELLSLENATPALIKDLSKLEPYGLENEEPLFLLKNVMLVSKHKLGKEENHLKLFIQEGNITKEVVFWNKALWYDQLQEKNTYDIIGCLQINEWNGQKKVQICGKDMRERD